MVDYAGRVNVQVGVFSRVHTCTPIKGVLVIVFIKGNIVEDVSMSCCSIFYTLMCEVPHLEFHLPWTINHILYKQLTLAVQLA